MKNICTLFLALIITGSLMAQAPQSFKYQAVARDGGGDVVAGQAVGMQISILQGSTGGASVYVETFTPSTNEFGLINLNIGAGTVVSGDFTTIDWSSDTYFIKVEMDITGGTTYEEYGTSQLLSVPYAMHAKTAENVTGTVTETDPVFTAWDKSYNDLTNKPGIIDSINTVVDTTTQFVRTEVDGDVANEIQDLSLSINTLSLSGDATSVDLSGYLDNTDIQNLSNVLAQGSNAGSNNITNLADPVNDQDAATKAYIDQIKAEIFTQIAGGKVTDCNGNSYKTVKIGEQVWMAENLKVTHYRNGDLIPNVTDSAEWSNLTIGARCYYDNDYETYAGTYGAMYNWYTVVDSRNLCPTGWHVPSDDEWKKLEMFLGMSQSEADGTGWRGTNEGSKLKESGTAHWKSPNTGATNESGFTALPGGYRHYEDSFFYIVDFGYWWSSLENDASTAWYRRLLSPNVQVVRYWYDKKNGYSVRCLKD